MKAYNPFGQYECLCGARIWNYNTRVGREVLPHPKHCDGTTMHYVRARIIRSKLTSDKEEIVFGIRGNKNE